MKNPILIPPNAVGPRECALGMGISYQALNQQAITEGFPRYLGEDAEWKYVVEEVRAWWAANVRPRAHAAAATVSDSSLASENDPFIVDMMSGKADALTITRAAMQMASRRVAKAAVSGTLGANDLDGLKKTLQELRVAEAGYIELGKAKADLIDAETMLSLVGELASRLVRCLNVVENAVSTEVEVWLGDAKFREGTADERARAVREFFSRTCKSVRGLESEDLRKTIADHVEKCKEEQ